jgi:hypothetical protein
MISAERLNSLEQQAARQIGPEMTTAIAVMPGELRELVRGYRVFAASEAAAKATAVAQDAAS